MPKPKAEREQRVAWRQSRVVVVGSTIGRASSVWWECDDDVPEASRSKAKGAGTRVAVVSGLAPSRLHARDGCIGEGRNEVAIAIERKNRIVRRFNQSIEQCTRRFR